MLQLQYSVGLMMIKDIRTSDRLQTACLHVNNIVKAVKLDLVAYDSLV